MNQLKKHTGKGHTLFEYECPKDQTDVWILVAESCYEISRTLLAQNTYAFELYFSVSGYDAASRRGGFYVTPQGFVRYPIELYKYLYNDTRAHRLIEDLLSDIRRVQVRVDCRPYITPLFDNTQAVQDRFELLEKIREKLKMPDIVGHGLEGLRSRRIATYTPKRSREIERAFELLALKPKLLELLSKVAQQSYWYRTY